MKNQIEQTISTVEIAEMMEIGQRAIQMPEDLKKKLQQEADKKG